MPTSRFPPPAKDQQVIVVCNSAAITAGDISGVMSAFKSLSGDGDRSFAMSVEGAVTLVFNFDVKHFFFSRCQRIARQGTLSITVLAWDVTS